MSHNAPTMLIAARRAVAVLGVLAVIIASLAHAFGHRETLSRNTSVVASLSSDLAGGDNLLDGSAVPAHHCAACVGIEFPEAIRPEAVDTVSSPVFGAPQRQLEPHGPVLHTPPPKRLA